MKRTSNFTFTQLGNFEMENLTNQVKETIAIELRKYNNSRKFTTVDLWNIKRLAKSRAGRSL